MWVHEDGSLPEALEVQNNLGKAPEVREKHPRGRLQMGWGLLHEERQRRKATDEESRHLETRHLYATKQEETLQMRYEGGWVGGNYRHPGH
jgi:hypothetical protein